MNDEELSAAIIKFAKYLEANGVKGVAVCVGRTEDNGQLAVGGYGSIDTGALAMAVFTASAHGMKVVPK